MGSESPRRDSRKPTEQDATGSPAGVKMPADFTSVIDALVEPVAELASEDRTTGRDGLTSSDGSADRTETTDTTAGPPGR
jgi:hypothetical protein